MAPSALGESPYYVYVLFRHDTGHPFYVGKGKGRRWLSHAGLGARDGNRHKQGIIRQAICAGKEIPSVRIAQGLTEDEAFAIERDLILAIGRVDNGGTLVNLSSGGGGQSGYRHSPECIEKIRLSSKTSRVGKKSSIATRAKIAEARRGKRLSEETKEKIRKSNAGRAVSPEARDNSVRFWLGHRHTECTKRKISVANSGRKLSDEHKALVSEALRNRPPVSDETREKLSAWQRGRKRSVEDRQKMKDGWAKRKAALLAAQQ